MISHNHKCIFIHISKCAGSSIEKALGVNIKDISENNNENLFGWNKKHELFLQHATPQQLLDKKFISHHVWESYFKFLIVRNPYDRAISDYKWLIKNSGVKDTFKNFLNAKGAFKDILNNKNIKYRGDHLTPQLDYFKLNDKIIEYDLVLRFENLNSDLRALCDKLTLPPNFFNEKVNHNSNKRKHYSKYYNNRLRELVQERYSDDLTFLNYRFEDKKNIIESFYNEILIQ